MINELLEHYRYSTNDNDIRRTRENGWDDVVKAYYGKLPEDWPYLAQVSIPIIRTTILEKNARLINGKLKGRLLPREDADEVKATIHNAILDYQWDNANFGGSMLEKWSLMDIQTRLFGASFALIYWRTEKRGDKVLYDGNDMKVLDNRDVFVDYTANHIKNAKWVQVREFKSLKDLEEENKSSSVPIYDLKEAKKNAEKDRRDRLYASVVKELRGIEDRVGTDSAFPTFEVVTEYRKDRWITFIPRLNSIIRDIDNPYKHNMIPVVQLRYYSVGDDVYGESEVETVLPIYRAINAIASSVIDENNLSARPPLKIANNETVTLSSLEYGPRALWLVGDSVNNVTEAQIGANTVNNFQVIYSSLLNAYNTAMGEMSQGVGVADPFSNEKTATEVRASQQQRLTRDQNNQLYLEQALKDQMMLWLLNNQQFVDDKSIIRVVGKNNLSDLISLGLHEEKIENETIDAVLNLINETEGVASDTLINEVLKLGQSYRYPVVKDGEVKPQLELDENGTTGLLTIKTDDLLGTYDYVPSITSMTINNSEMMKQSREKGLQLLLNPNIMSLLQLEGEKPKIKDLLIQILEDNNIKDATKFFEKQQQPTEQGIAPGQQVSGVNEPAGMGGIPQPIASGGEAPLPQPQGF